MPVSTSGVRAIEDICLANVNKILTPAVNHLFGIKLGNCLESMAVFKISVIHPFYSNSVIPRTEKKKLKFQRITHYLELYILRHQS